MRCPSCGSEAGPGAGFCPQCGAYIDAGNPSPPGYAPPGAPPAAPYGASYGAPYGPPPAFQGGGVAIASLVLGIIAVVLGFMTCIPYLNYCTCFLEPVVALIAIVLGIVGLSSSADAQGKGHLGPDLGDCRDSHLDRAACSGSAWGCQPGRVAGDAVFALMLALHPDPKALVA
jgi:uncharacterized membrane protein YtjA (UPF0391 family)